MKVYTNKDATTKVLGAIAGISTESVRSVLLNDWVNLGGEWTKPLFRVDNLRTEYKLKLRKEIGALLALFESITKKIQDANADADAEIEKIKENLDAELFELQTELDSVDDRINEIEENYRSIHTERNV
jgi:chromosome segregation ATPase